MWRRVRVLSAYVKTRGLKDRAAKAAGPGQVGGSRDCVRSKVKPGVGQASRVSIIAESAQVREALSKRVHFSIETFCSLPLRVCGFWDFE